MSRCRRNGSDDGCHNRRHFVFRIHPIFGTGDDLLAHRGKRLQLRQVLIARMAKGVMILAGLFPMALAGLGLVAACYGLLRGHGDFRPRPEHIDRALLDVSI